MGALGLRSLPADRGARLLRASEAAFYPLYPALVAVVGRVLGGHFVLGGILVSLLAALGAFVLLERLAEERFGGSGARRALLYLALFPTAFFLQAVYSESLFLVLCLAAFVLAERGRFAYAGIVVGLAILTRPTGIVLLPALALIARRQSWKLVTALARRSGVSARALARGRRSVGVRPRRRNVAPASLAGRAARRDLGRPARRLGRRSSSSPPARTRTCTGLRSPRRTRRRSAPPSSTSSCSGFLVVFIALAAIAWRRLGAPYGLFAVLSLALPAQHPEHALAAPLAAALRPRDLPVLPRARVAQRPGAPRSRGDPRHQRTPPRGLRHAVGALGLGRIETRTDISRVNRRLVYWLLLVLALAGANYAARFSEGKPPKDILYQWDNAIGGVVQYGVILAFVLAIARGALLVARAAPAAELVVGRRPRARRARRDLRRLRDRLAAPPPRAASRASRPTTGTRLARRSSSPTRSSSA